MVQFAEENQRKHRLLFPFLGLSIFYTHICALSSPIKNGPLDPPLGPAWEGPLPPSPVPPCPAGQCLAWGRLRPLLPPLAEPEGLPLTLRPLAESPSTCMSTGRQSGSQGRRWSYANQLHRIFLSHDISFFLLNSQGVWVKYSVMEEEDWCGEKEAASPSVETAVPRAPSRTLT